MILGLSASNGHTPAACSCKVGKARDRYSIDDLDESLRRRRQNEGASLRDLADYVNRSILSAVLTEDAPSVLTDSEAFGALDKTEAVEQIHRVLTDDEVPSDRRARVESRLTQAGVDIESVRSAWVTHPTIRTHLRDCLDIDTSHSSDLDAEGGIQTIEWARSQCIAIVDRTIERLKNSGQVAITDPDISLSLRITCTACGETYRPTALIRSGSCSCPSHATSGDS